MSVEVFKTTIQDSSQADAIAHQLEKIFPELKINFDLEDCDKIMRVEGQPILSSEIIKVVIQLDFDCAILE